MNASALGRLRGDSAVTPASPLCLGVTAFRDTDHWIWRQRPIQLRLRDRGGDSGAPLPARGA